MASAAIGPACAQVSAPASDEALVAARTAAQTGNWDIVRSLLPRVQSHVLAAYPHYWWLRRQLNDPDKPLPEAELNEFVSTHRGTYLAERLRGEWLLAAAKQADYATVRTLADTTVNTPQVDCAVLLAMHARGERVTPQQAIGKFSPGESCWALYDRLQADGVMPWEMFAAQMRDLLETNSLANAQRMARYVFDTDQLKTLNRVLNQPMVWLARQNGVPRDRAERELVVVALTRLARNDMQVGYDYFERNWARQLPAADAGWVRNQFALQAAFKLDPIAAAWYRAGEGGRLTEYNQAWRARMVLRQQPVDWRTLNRYIEQMPPSMRSEPAWVYWHSRGLVALGAEQAGQEGFRSIASQFNFYGQLAAEELGIATTIPTSSAPVTPEELAQAQYNPGLQRAIALFRLGWRTEGVREWNYALRGMSDRQLLAAAQLAHRENLYDRAVNTAERTREQHDFNLRFLSPFRDQLVDKAREIGVDPTWVYGLIRQESRFVMDARSSAGASGLMQLMPATAKWVARRIGMSDYAQHRVNDMDTNLTLGTSYLRIVLDDLGGSPLLASAGYNAGPRRPHAWRSTLAGPIEGAIFAETIPFTETRDYVQKVLSNATYYAALFTGQPQSLKARLGTVVPQAVETTAIP
ncbi:MAG: transglycosylase SLT domain-containing protein [Pigmentiphaga sp.]|uniref:lytic transglycosylase domain-containing protein n=1 Tax=Pigmentiphaga sp. TaxID=1977564 RepID=UPI0029AF1CB6|nr:transglycosylase SLT domain-containing protein [Pigmentiphaga sp.]MDX3907069.1 transglycosylase SLT domain-containing protein [Pigmentiphaga sp.]